MNFTKILTYCKEKLQEDKGRTRHSHAHVENAEQRKVNERY